VVTPLYGSVNCAPVRSADPSIWAPIILDLTAGSEVAYEANGASNPQPIRLNCTLTGCIESCMRHSNLPPIRASHNQSADATVVLAIVMQVPDK
jgi:hypothetical protein